MRQNLLKELYTEEQASVEVPAGGASSRAVTDPRIHDHLPRAYIHRRTSVPFPTRR